VFRYIIYILLFAAILSCGGKNDNVQQKKQEATNQNTHYDLDEIEESGEIIAVTMYGRNTYYDYHGKETGIAYEMLQNFAKGEGMGVRVETASDTAAMIKMLKSGEADIILSPLTKKFADTHKLIICGMGKPKGADAFGWAVRKDQPELAAALNSWYKPGMEKYINKKESGSFGITMVKRHVRAPYISRSKGIISQYDAEFMKGSRHIGWDWRLIAAQCYQESGFDPNAVSWAGAKGLMQIIPSTAASLGIKNIYDPKENIDAGCRYLKRLHGSFNDVRNRIDRIRFVLAAYNGGPRHIRDAMNLAKKYGKSPTSYNDVSFFIRNLDKPQYYNDPVVKYGFMIGSETYNYVESIMLRWGKYRGGKAVATLTDNVSISPFTPQQSHHRNRFTGGKHEIINLKDSI